MSTCRTPDDCACASFIPDAAQLAATLHRQGREGGHLPACPLHACVKRPVIAVGTTGHEIDPNGVNHPRHYNIHPAGIEAIDVIEHMTANVAFVFKHLWRAGLKEGEATLKDIDKALWYLKRERERLVKAGVK